MRKFVESIKSKLGLPKGSYNAIKYESSIQKRRRNLKSVSVQSLTDKEIFEDQYEYYLQPVNSNNESPEPSLKTQPVHKVKPKLEPPIEIQTQKFKQISEEYSDDNLSFKSCMSSNDLLNNDLEENILTTNDIPASKAESEKRKKYSINQMVCNYNVSLQNMIHDIDSEDEAEYDAYNEYYENHSSKIPDIPDRNIHLNHEHEDDAEFEEDLYEYIEHLDDIEEDASGVSEEDVDAFNKYLATRGSLPVPKEDALEYVGNYMNAVSKDAKTECFGKELEIETYKCPTENLYYDPVSLEDDKSIRKFEEADAINKKCDEFICPEDKTEQNGARSRKTWVKNDLFQCQNDSPQEVFNGGNNYYDVLIHNYSEDGIDVGTLQKDNPNDDKGFSHNYIKNEQERNWEINDFHALSKTRKSKREDSLKEQNPAFFSSTYEVYNPVYEITNIIKRPEAVEIHDNGIQKSTRDISRETIEIPCDIIKENPDVENLKRCSPYENYFDRNNIEISVIYENTSPVPYEPAFDRNMDVTMPSKDDQVPKETLSEPAPEEVKCTKHSGSLAEIMEMQESVRQVESRMHGENINKDELLKMLLAELRKLNGLNLMDFDEEMLLLQQDVLQRIQSCINCIKG